MGAAIFLVTGVSHILLTWDRVHWTADVVISGPLFGIAMLFLLIGLSEITAHPNNWGKSESAIGEETGGRDSSPEEVDQMYRAETYFEISKPPWQARLKRSRARDC